MLALASGMTALAEVTSESRTPETYPQAYMRPINVTAQLEYCRKLLEMKEDSSHPLEAAFVTPHSFSTRACD